MLTHYCAVGCSNHALDKAKAQIPLARDIIFTRDFRLCDQMVICVKAKMHELLIDF